MNGKYENIFVKGVSFSKVVLIDLREIITLCKGSFLSREQLIELLFSK